MTKLLLIDDEETNVRVLAVSLRSDNYEVVTAYDGENGIKVFKEESPEIVITDIKMPGMSGIDVLKKIKSIDPDTEVIIITGHGDIDNAVEALKYGASDFINKPIGDDVLSIALQRAQEKREIKKKLKNYTERLENDVQTATTELRRKSNFLSKLIQSSNDGIVATDKDFEIVIFNPGAERIFGYKREEVENTMKAGDLYPSEIKDILVNESDQRHVMGGLPWIETTITDKENNTIPVRFSGTLLYEHNEMMGSVAFFQDLREIKRLEAELVRSERLAAVGQTVAGVAHGVKNILHGFKGGRYLVDIGIKKNNNEKIIQGWEMVQKNITRTSELVMDLLAYSKEREPEFVLCSPNEIANDVCETLQQTADENSINLVRDFDPAIEEVVMDSRTIHRSLMNLVSNAIDACLFDENHDKNMEVTLKTGLENGNTIRFDVIDNGMGMSEEVKQKIFASFFSTKGHLGTGLGLLVTRKHIEEHGGKIDVSSQVGSGSKFSVRLPFRYMEKG